MRVISAVTVLCLLGGNFSHAAALDIPSPGHPIWAVQIDYKKPHDVPWKESDFIELASKGLNRVEINLDWGEIEPEKGRYDFSLLDSYLGAIAQAKLKLILIFWESVWQEKTGKNPPPWLSTRDVTSDGITAQQPPWWDEDSRQAYFDYVARTIEHVKDHPGFGGLFADYGWLDAMWGPQPRGSHGVTGYASADINELHRWVSGNYGTLVDFNHRWHTAYRDWSDIPAAKPGEPLFPLYQEFRYHSVESAYDSLSQLVRAHTNAPLFYYWGGGIGGKGGASVLGNDPDLFFRLAKRHAATIVFDDADHTGLALIFGSLARSYGVPLMQEWTPNSHASLKAETPQWLGHIGLGSSFEVGEDFFIYPLPNPGFDYAWSAYQSWHSTLAGLRGAVPSGPVAVIISTWEMATGADLNAFSELDEQISSFWRKHFVLPEFVTDQEIRDGVVHLDKFRAIVAFTPSSGALCRSKGYPGNRPVFPTLEEALPYLKSYAALSPANDSIEAVPIVQKSSAWLTLANCKEQLYDGALLLDPKAIGLKEGSYVVEDAQTHKYLAAQQLRDGRIQIPLQLDSSAFKVLRIQESMKHGS